MRRVPTVRRAGLVILAVAAVLAGDATPSGASTSLPPELVALEQQMAQLQTNSERFAFQEELSLGELLGQGDPLILIIAGEGEASDSPPQASVVGGIFGLPEEHTRTIGETVYRYRRGAAEVDGGRPWVSAPRASKSAAGLDPGGLLESDEAGGQGTFSKLIAELNGGLSVEQSGPAIVDGQRTIEFDATLDPTPFVEQLRAKSTTPKKPLKSLFELPSVDGPKTPAKAGAPPSLELEVFIAPNGLPVRVRFTFSAEGATIAVRVDTLAINVPVHVTPPPAAQTITEAQLKQIERRRAARALRLGLRACRHLRGKRAAACRAIARLRSAAPHAEASPL